MFRRNMSRRDVLKAAPFGFGYLALAGLCGEASAQFRDPLAVKQPHVRPRAKRVIFLCMTGGPSHVDTFDHKPKLAEDAGQMLVVKNQNGIRHYGGPLSPSAFKFTQHGQSGQWISELFPHLAGHADDLCVVRSMVTDIPEHSQAILQLHTGEFRFIRPSVGSWVLYGLGNESRDLPGFITINPPSALHGGAQNYSSAFLPAAYQGMPLEQQRLPLHLPSLQPAQQRQQIDLIQSMNRDLLAQQQVDVELEGLINSFELGFRMQTVLPKLMDVSTESKPTLESYGKSPFGRQCLLARRFAEAGVRFVEVCSHGWDHHGDIVAGLKTRCGEVDQPIAALLTDLKGRGLLDDTLVIWGGEFGRSPASEGKVAKVGRPHNALGYTMWLAGGGVKPGLSFGATDDYGLVAVDNPVHLHDLHATLLYMLGLDHQKLTYRYGGRDYSLTDIHGRVVKEILA